MGRHLFEIENLLQSHLDRRLPAKPEQQHPPVSRGVLAIKRALRRLACVVRRKERLSLLATPPCMSAVLSFFLTPFSCIIMENPYRERK